MPSSFALRQSELRRVAATSCRLPACEIAACSGRQSVVAGEDAARVYRLRQGQSRQDQYASVGSGAATNLAGELFKEMTGVDIVNMPYRDSYIPDLLERAGAGRVRAVLQSLSFIRAGKLRPLAVTGIGALRGVAGRSQCQRIRAGLRSVRLGRGRRAGAHAAGDHRALNEEHQRGARRSRDQAAIHRSRRSALPMVMSPAEFGKASWPPESRQVG